MLVFETSEEEIVSESTEDAYLIDIMIIKWILSLALWW